MARDDPLTGNGGQLVLVATPIGNLSDLSPRAAATLGSASVICCEDTRRTRALLAAAGLPSNPRRLVSLHRHNEAARVERVIGWVRAGKLVAVVSDAGTPGISDPGQRLAAAAAACGLPVRAVPGPSAVLAALAVSGLPAERFCFEGFLPRKGRERRDRLSALSTDTRTTVLLESPVRLGSTLADLAEACGDRSAAVARELTKLHEEVWRGRLREAAEYFSDRAVRGEVVVVVEGAGDQVRPGELDEHAVRSAVSARLAGGEGIRSIADEVAETLGISRRRAYSIAIEVRDGQRSHS